MGPDHKDPVEVFGGGPDEVVKSLFPGVLRPYFFYAIWKRRCCDNSQNLRNINCGSGTLNYAWGKSGLA